MQAALADPELSAEGRALAEFVRGSLAFGHGDPSTCVQALREARRLHQQLGDEVRAATDAILLGIAVGVRAPDSAERLEREVVDVLRRHGEPWKLALALFALGRVLVLSGKTREAVPLLEESVRIQHRSRRGDSSGPHPLLGYAMVNLGWARLGLDDVDGAREALRQALTVAGEADQQVRARALEGLAAVAVRDGDASLGVVLFGGAEGVRRAIGIGVWLTDQRTHHATEAALREALGDRYEEAFEDGARRPTAEVQALACGELPAPGAAVPDAAAARQL
jgi:hypothetical protein